MANERKLDLFGGLLPAIDRNNGTWLSKQPEDAQKEFVPVVAIRYAATVENSSEAAYMLWMINERVNVHMFELYKHPDLIFRLMASCGLGSPVRHQWLPLHKRKGGSNKAFDFLAELHPEASNREVDMLLSKYTKETFTQLVKDCGIQPDPAKALIKAFQSSEQS